MDEPKAPRPLAVVTGASSGIGYHLAMLAAQHEFFERADLLDTKVGADMKKDDPAMVARLGFDAMFKGEADVVAGWKSKAQVIASKVLPAQAVAAAHRKLAEPGSAKHDHPGREEAHPVGAGHDKEDQR